MPFLSSRKCKPMLTWPGDACQMGFAFFIGLMALPNRSYGKADKATSFRGSVATEESSEAQNPEHGARFAR